MNSDSPHIVMLSRHHTVFPVSQSG